MEKYASEYVCEEDREDFLRNMNYRVVRERIKTEKVYPVVFQRKFNGKIDYFQACFAQISEDTDDFVLGFKLVNDIVEHEKERNDRLEEEKQILESLSSDFTAIYYLEVNSGKFEPVHIQNETNASELIKSYSGYKDFYEYAYQYAMRYIPKDEQPEFLWWFSRDNLKSLLKTQVSLTQNYRCYPNAQNHQYFETKVVKVSEDEESCHVLLGFRYIDDIIKKEKATQKRLQNALEEIKRSNETISAIAKSYSSIYKVDFETDTYERITGSDVIPKTGCASEKMFDVCEQDVAPEYRNIIHQFTNIETLTSRLEKEKDVFGFYLSSHPTNLFKKDNPYCIPLNEIEKYFSKKVDTLILVDKIKIINTKNGEKMAFLTGSDETSTMEYTLFPKVYNEYSDIQKGDLLKVRGRVEKRLNQYQIIVEKVRNLQAGDIDEK